MTTITTKHLQQAINSIIQDFNQATESKIYLICHFAEEKTIHLEFSNQQVSKLRELLQNEAIWTHKHGSFLNKCLKDALNYLVFTCDIYNIKYYTLSESIKSDTDQLSVLKQLNHDVDTPPNPFDLSEPLDNWALILITSFNKGESPFAANKPVLTKKKPLQTFFESQCFKRFLETQYPESSKLMKEWKNKGRNTQRLCKTIIKKYSCNILDDILFKLNANWLNVNKTDDIILKLLKITTTYNKMSKDSIYIKFGKTIVNANKATLCDTFVGFISNIGYYHKSEWSTIIQKIVCTVLHNNNVLSYNQRKIVSNKLKSTVSELIQKELYDTAIKIISSSMLIEHQIPKLKYLELLYICYQYLYDKKPNNKKQRKLMLQQLYHKLSPAQRLSVNNRFSQKNIKFEPNDQISAMINYFNETLRLDSFDVPIFCMTPAFAFCSLMYNKHFELATKRITQYDINHRLVALYCTKYRQNIDLPLIGKYIKTLNKKNKMNDLQRIYQLVAPDTLKNLNDNKEMFELQNITKVMQKLSKCIFAVTSIKQQQKWNQLDGKDLLNLFNYKNSNAFRIKYEFEPVMYKILNDNCREQIKTIKANGCGNFIVKQKIKDPQSRTCTLFVNTQNQALWTVLLQCYGNILKTVLMKNYSPSNKRQLDQLDQPTNKRQKI